MLRFIKKFKKKKKQNKNLHKPLLVLLSDGFGLLAAVVDKKDEEVTIVASARSNLSEPASALIEVFGRLSVSYGKLPKETIMLHAHSIPSQLELAIDNIDVIEEDKLQELIRWEMESIFADLVPHDNLGWLMVGLNFISETQRDELIKKLKTENSESNIKMRIGDLAISEGYINRNQLESCLKVQDQLQLQDQRVKCGWSRIVNATEKQWLATAVSSSVHEQWVTALQTVSAKGAIGKTRLKSFYPFIGAVASQLSPIYSGEIAYILELHRPYMALSAYKNGDLLDSLVLGCSSDTPQLNDIESLLQNADVPEGSDIYVMSTHADRVGLREQLDELSRYYFRSIEREIKIPTNLSGDVSTAEAIMIFGATFNYLTDHHQLMVPVQGVTPPPPVMQRKETKVAASVLIVVFLISAIEGGLAWKLSKTRTKVSAIEDKVNIQEKLKQDLTKSKRAQATLKHLENEYQSLQELKKMMETVLVKRNNFMGVFFDIVVLNMNDNLLLDSIVERQWNEFIINGWSLDQASVEYFNQGLSRDLREWEMGIVENPSELDRSNNNEFSGYKFRMVIKKVSANNLVR